MKTILFIFRLFFLSLAVISCRHKENTRQPDAQSDEIAATDSIEYFAISRDQFATSGMQLGGLRIFDYAESVHANGYIDVPPENRAKIGTFMGGYVESAGLLPGDRIQKGQVLVVLQNIEYLRLQQDYLEAREQLEYLKSVYESQKELAAEKISAQRNFLQARSDYNSMLARYKSLEEQLKLLQIDPDAVKPDNLVSTIKLTSPINGYITKSEAVRGMFVDPSDILCEIIDPSHLHVELKVFEKDISRLRKGQSIDFRIPEASGESCRGEVVLIGREIEGDERTVTVHGHITRRTGMNLTPGMYVEAVINTDPGRVEGLPAEAFVNQEGRSYVYVKESERKDEILFRMIPVRTGKSTEEWSEIYDSTGVLHRAAGSILIKGAYYLAPE